MNNKVYHHTAPYKIEAVNDILTLPTEKYVTLEYLYCGICGGDYSTYIGRRNDFPYSLGHEFVGRVTNIGDDVSTLHIGDYVISDFNYRCGKCSNCISGNSHLCLQNDAHKFSNRAFSQYGNIHESYLYKIPSFSFLPKACLIEPLSCVIHACNLCKLNKDMSIVINGCGSIGMLFIFYLSKILSYENIYINEINKMREKNIIKYFPVKVYDPDMIDKYDYIIECSNSTNGIKKSLDLCSFGGHICIMSHLYGINTSFIYENICKKELVPIFPLRNGNIDTIKLAINYIGKFWDDGAKELLGIYDDIYLAFNKKNITSFNKQIVKIPH